jgi:hypothetical protein
MKQNHWREMVEIVGVLSIVAAILLLASEVRQSNHIAQAKIEIDVSQLYNEVNMSRATDPDFAKLFAKVRDPDSHLLTATDLSQIEGLAWHYLNNFRVIQLAFDQGLINQIDFDSYKSDIALIAAANPALLSEWREILEQDPSLSDKEIFTPISDMFAAMDTEAAD